LPVIFLAALLYLAGVPDNPPGFHLDESSVSYNAHAIAQTGRDEHGTPWPLFFRAFGDYKNPVYIYLLAGLFKLAGPSIWAGRLLSALAGMSAALLLGLLALGIARRRDVAILATLSALLTPWLFETSRVVMEVALYPLILALFLLCLHRVSAKAKWSYTDIASLAITLALLTYTYSIGRLLAPLLAFGLVLFVTRQRWMSVLQAWGAYLLTLLPMFLFNRHHPGALTGRFKLITYITPQSSYGEIVLGFIRHFVGNLNVWRLIVSGDPNPDQVVHLSGTPHMLAATLAFAVIGGCLVLRQQRRSAWWRFIFYGLVVSVVPASLTEDFSHMLRLVALPVFLLVLSVPAYVWLIERAKLRRGWRVLFASLLALALLQGAFFQWQFRRSANTPRRLHLFDAEYPRLIFAQAVAHPSRPIYLADAPAIPGYIQAYWYATLRGIEPSQFVRLSPAETPPAGAVVISTEEDCPRCDIIAISEPYTLYIASAPSSQDEGGSR
jgi:4-amino-4-deoxy-L-arabinose transferase-like glycosyltransferase